MRKEELLTVAGQKKKELKKLQAGIQHPCALYNGVTDTLITIIGVLKFNQPIESITAPRLLSSKF